MGKFFLFIVALSIAILVAISIHTSNLSRVVWPAKRLKLTDNGRRLTRPCGHGGSSASRGEDCAGARRLTVCLATPLPNFPEQ